MIKQFIHNHIYDLLVVLFLITFSIVIWWPSHYYPLFWDSTFLVHTAQSILKSNFTRLVTEDLGYAQPTLLGTLLALCWKFFGTSITISHLLMLPFLPMILISTYFFVTHKTNRTLGFLSSALIAFTPVVLAEYVNVYLDLPSAGFVALSLLMWQKKKYPLWAIFFTCALLTKLPTIAIAPYFFIQALTLGKKKLGMTIFLPLLVVTSWLAYHYALTGWLLNSPNFQLAVARPSFNPIPEMVSVIYLIFTGQGRIYISLVALVGIFWLFYSNKPKLKQIIGPTIIEDLLPIGASALLFVMAGEFGFRYAIFLAIFYVTIISKILYQYILKYPKSSPYVYSIFLVGIALIASTWHPRESALKSTRFNPPDDLGIIDYLYVFRSIASYAEVHRSEKIQYYGAFPENEALTDPIFGFVKEPVPFSRCEKFTLSPQVKQVIIIHPFSPTQYPCLQITQSLPTTIIGGSEHNGKWVDLFLIDASAATVSAQSSVSP